MLASRSDHRGCHPCSQLRDSYLSNSLHPRKLISRPVCNQALLAKFFQRGDVTDTQLVIALHLQHLAAAEFAERMVHPDS